MAGAGFSNLPHPITPLVGRTREVAAIKRLLDDPALRLLTLTGPGGVGKTRLALRAAEMACHDFADGVVFVDLAPLTDPALVPAVIAQAIGLSLPAGRPVDQALVDHLTDRNLLLVLDNFEHLLDGAKLVPRLLATCPDLVVLSTSRQRLSVYGEQVYPVEPLPLPAPNPTRPPTIDDVAGSDAGCLFITRARAAWPSFALTDANAADIAAICTHLDGLPLAIELAAARSALLSPEAMRARLDRVLPLLAGGGRDQPERQRAMRDTIAWSYDALTSTEQSLLRRLSVFAGGCSLEAAEAIAGDSPQTPSVIDTMSSLLEKSLVRRIDGQRGTPRFFLLQTIREFGLTQLQEHGEDEESRWTHAGYFLRLVEQAEPEIKGSRHTGWIEILEEENANIQSAIQWSLSRGDQGSETALRICQAVWWFWKGWGHLAAARFWLRRAIDVGGDANPRFLARVLLFLGHTMLQGNLSEARSSYQRSLDLCLRFGDAHGEAWALCGLGMVASDVGEYEEAKRLLIEARQIYEDLQDTYGMTLTIHHLGSIAAKRRDLPEATCYTEQALEGWRRLNQGANAVYALIDLARLQRLQRQAQPATTFLVRAQDLNRSIGSKEAEGYIALEFGKVALLKKRPNEALDFLSQALIHFERSGLRDYSTAAAIEGIASIALAEGQCADAVDLLAAAESWRDETKIRLLDGDRLVVEQDLKLARKRLGEEVFAANWTAGKSILLDDAIATALSITVTPKPDAEAKSQLPSDLQLLSPREREVLCMIARGLKDREVGEELGISARTVETLMHRVLDKLSTQHANPHFNRTSAATYAATQGLCDLSFMGVRTNRNL